MKKIFISGCLVTSITIALFAQTRQSVPRAVLERGQFVYEATCLACHQANGSGIPFLNPPLKGKYIDGDKSALINVVLKGLNEEIEIDGVNYNNPMPSFAQLADQEIADVLTYVRNSFGNKGALISAGQVKAERAKLK